MKLRKNKNRIKFIKKDEQIDAITQSITETFTFKRLIIEVIDIFFAYLISHLIEDPLLSLAHYLRTQEWTYIINLFAFLLFLFFIGIFLILIYYLSKSLRKPIKESILYQKESFLRTIIGISFAFLIINMFYDFFFSLANYIYIGFNQFDFDIGSLIDRIIASLILLGIILFYYITRFEINKRKLNKKKSLEKSSS